MNLQNVSSERITKINCESIVGWALLPLSFRLYLISLKICCVPHGTSITDNLNQILIKSSSNLHHVERILSGEGLDILHRY